MQGRSAYGSIDLHFAIELHPSLGYISFIIVLFILIFFFFLLLFLLCPPYISFIFLMNQLLYICNRFITIPCIEGHFNFLFHVDFLFILHLLSNLHTIPCFGRRFNCIRFVHYVSFVLIAFFFLLLDIRRDLF